MKRAHAELLECRRLFATIFAADVTFGSGGLAATETEIGTLAVLPDGNLLGLGSQVESIDWDNNYFPSSAIVDTDGNILSDYGDDNYSSGFWFYGGLRYYREDSGDYYVDNIRAFGDGAESFGNGGVVPVPTGVELSDTYDSVRATFIAALPDGTLYLDIEHRFANDYGQQYHELTRLKADGSVDTTFGNNGFIIFGPGDPAGGFQPIYTSKGLIRYAQTDTQVKLTRYQSDGITVDTSFGDRGTATLNVSVAYAFKEQADGKILYVNNEPGTESTLKFRMSRLNADGSPDTSFGDAGSVTMQSPADDVLRESAVIELDPQQRIWVAAATRLYRFNSAGVLDAAPFDGSQRFDDLPFTFDSAGRLYAVKSYFGIQRFAEFDPIVLDGDRLTITGTGDGDSITITQDASGGIDVTVTQLPDGVLPIEGTPVTQHFNAGEIASIHITAGAGWDVITNDSAIPCTVESGDGNDTVFGGSGADRLDGGAGDDSLWGNDGNDRIAGDEGSDSLYGNGGKDKIYGGLQPDFIRGNDGRDKLYGNGGNDRIYGGASGDSIYGQGGNDQLFGEGGNDRIYSDYASGNSTLRGGAGNDTFITANGLIDAIFGDGGHDIATADPSDLLTSIEEQVAL